MLFTLTFKAYKVDHAVVLGILKQSHKLERFKSVEFIFVKKLQKKTTFDFDMLINNLSLNFQIEKGESTRRIIVGSDQR